MCIVPKNQTITGCHQRGGRCEVSFKAAHSAWIFYVHSLFCVLTSQGPIEQYLPGLFCSQIFLVSPVCTVQLRIAHNGFWILKWATLSIYIYFFSSWSDLTLAWYIFSFSGHLSFQLLGSCICFCMLSVLCCSAA